MSWNCDRIIYACVTSLFMAWSAQAWNSELNLQEPDLRTSFPSHSTESLSLDQIQNYARSITVKVQSGRSWGSGILIQRKGQSYSVLTNAHVLVWGEQYRVQTPDGAVYPAQKDTSINWYDNDLAILHFRSANNYEVANLAKTSPLTPGEQVFAAGFPASGNVNSLQGLIITNGEVSSILSQPLIGGYQVGYSNNVEKGMSGGPVINIYGEVVAINGKHKYPLWGQTFMFSDGSIPALQKQEEMERYSWAIPIKNFLRLAPE